MTEDRLVMFAGTGAAVGKTSVSTALAETLRRRGHKTVFVPELVIFDWPELADLADAFRRRAYPDAGALLGGFSRLLEGLPAAEWIVFDGNWVLLAEDLPWAQASWEDTVAFARGLRERTTHRYHLTVVYLQLDPAEVISRHRRRDGKAAFSRWLNYLRRLPALQLDPDTPPVEVARAWSRRLREIWVAAGQPLQCVPAVGTPDEVLARVLTVLEL